MTPLIPILIVSAAFARPPTKQRSPTVSYQCPAVTSFVVKGGDRGAWLIAASTQYALSCSITISGLEIVR